MIYTSTAHLPCHINMVDVLGFLAAVIDEEAPESLREQIDAAYAQCGGWRPSTGFTLDKSDMSLNYPGDPPLLPWVEARLRDEVLLVYPHSWVMVLQPDDSFTVARID